MQRIEAYYGVKYSAGQAPYVKTYLADRSERALDFLFAETLKVFSAQFNHCPDIAIFDRLRGGIQERLEQEPDLSIPEITDTAGNEYIDSCEIADNLGIWLKSRNFP